jgi:hypothetical protein
MGQLDLGKGPARLEIRYHGQGVDVQSKGFSFHTTKMCSKYLNNMYPCVLEKKRFLCAVKNKPRVEIRYMSLFLAHRCTWLRTVTSLI